MPTLPDTATAFKDGLILCKRPEVFIIPGTFQIEFISYVICRLVYRIIDETARKIL